MLFFVLDSFGQSTKPLRILYLGDSYTKGEGLKSEETFPYLVSQKLQNKGIQVKNPVVIAETGWTAGNLMSAIRGLERSNYGNHDTFDYITLCIGVNNQYQGRSTIEYAYLMREVIRIAMKYVNYDTTRFIVLSIPNYGYTPYGKKMDVKKINFELDSFNFYAKLEAKNNRVKFIDITESSKLVSKDNTLLAPDQLHYSRKMYDIWADKIVNQIILKKK